MGVRLFIRARKFGVRPFSPFERANVGPWLVLVAILGVLFSACRPAREPRRTDPLEVSLRAIPHNGRLSVTVLHFGTGRRISIAGDVRMPMMSVFKLPLAVVALTMVEEGKLSLDRKIPIAEDELRRGVSPIAEEWDRGVHEVTLETMLVRVIQDSDNTAGDKLVTLEGGGPAITAKLRALGIRGIDIAEQEIEIFRRLNAGGTAQHEMFEAPNAASTDALVDLMAALERGSILQDKSRAWLRETLAGTKTGPKRLKGQLPEGTRVEHKTGTGGDVDGVGIATNDIGIVTLPDGQRFAIAVLTSGTKGDAEDVIARVARTTWDAFADPTQKDPRRDVSP